MKDLILALVLLEAVLYSAYAQRVAPGVPPQHYQQQQQQQYQPPQYQQPQYQQAQYQQPQVPVQQQHQQQQLPNPHAHGHGHQVSPEQVLNTANIAHEKEHIAEHLDVPIDTSKMSDQELQFHYFKMHDADNNNKLDGCELVKSLLHWHGTEDKNFERHYTDEQLEQSLEVILNLMDSNRDGYIDYFEYIKENKRV